MEKTKENKGITLVALIVIIIVLLILASISVVMLTENNGILSQSQKAKEQTEIASEKEALQLTIMSQKVSKEEKNNIGAKLYDKTVANGNKWNVIKDNENNITYGTGWNYIEKGTQIESWGKAQKNWVINYETGEIKELKENSYNNLKYGKNLAVSEGLVLNVDPVNMEDKNSWGDGVTLYGVQDGDGYGWNGSEIKFDGVDDYIEVYTDVSADEGITFEFYAKSNIQNQKVGMLSKIAKGEDISYFRSFIEGRNMFSASASVQPSQSKWSEGNPANVKHWIYREMEDMQLTEGAYITVSINLKDSIITLYKNGEYLDSTKCSEQWLKNSGLDNSKIPFIIGMCVTFDPYVEFYSNIDLYACRLYNKILTDKEIKENCQKTINYHEILVNN